MKKRVISLMCAFAIMLSTLSSAIPLQATATTLDEGKIIEKNSVPLKLQYDEEAPYGNEGISGSPGNNPNDGWERWSLPIGNGYFGANVFGRTETERIQITEKTLSNPYYKNSPEGTRYSLGGLNNFSETYIDIGHPFASVTDYSRWLDLNTAISGVSYNYEGVTYSREYFTSYPDKVLVIRLDTSEAGRLNFVLRPTVPWEQEYAAWEGDGASKTGEVVSYLDGEQGVIELYGKMGYYDVDFIGMYKVVTNGGTVTATTCINSDGDTDGTITVSGATSAFIYVALGSDYELSSEMFTAAEDAKPTFDTTLEDAREKVEAEFNSVADKLVGKSFEEAYAVLKNNHLNDYTELFGRVSLDLGDTEDAALMTDELLANYQSSTHSRYLEVLYYQYGRYLLIASSRPGTLVANLQGTWNRYNKAPWGSGIWHNVNVQMNYWPAFSANLAETFEAYVGYNAAYMEAAESNATKMIATYNPSSLGLDGGNGWCIGTGAFPYNVTEDRSAGNLGFTTQLFWEYYEYTRDRELLENIVYPILVSAARYIVKSVELDADGKYLVSHCDSPEMFVNGVWYYTKGTTYAQSFAYQNNYNALLAARELGIDLSDSELLNTEELCVFKRVMDQLDKYDPILVGLSGQIKEFREEDYYCSIGDEPQHRHTSQLVGLYPGNIINSNTPAWLDAAKVTLTNRGDNATGWGIAFRLNLWARTKEGDRTYQVLKTLLKTSTATNLWDLHPPFQIDGNLGGTAGITEMLLQSHEGYIAPLAAIPTDWDSGSYAGLVARGNFEVAAEWENGAATCFNITSNAGGVASVCYDGIASAKVVRASDGRRIDYSVSGANVISFDTEIGETYIISGFEIGEKLPAPASMTVERHGLGNITLSWQEVLGATRYNVYKAVESQPDYTFVATVAEASSIYVPKKDEVNSRMTFKVVPVSFDGTEGKGVIGYWNPVSIEPVLDSYEANLFEDGELQITLKASDNASTYKLWKKAAGASEYSLVAESLYPVIITEGYTKGDEYAISIVSKYLNTESKIYEITKIKNATAVSASGAGKWNTNILSSTAFVPSDEAAGMVLSAKYGYNKLTDGVYNKDTNGAANIHLGRFSTKDEASMMLDGTITFSATHILGEMRLYDFFAMDQTRLGDSITVYAYSGGEWRQVASIEGRSAILAAKKLDSNVGLYYLPINLAGVRCEAIRVVCENLPTFTQSITIYEITCSGIALNSELVYKDDLLEGKAPTYHEHTGNNNNYTVNKINDGSFDLKTGRYALLDGENNYFTVEYDIDSEAVLNLLKVYELTGVSETVSRASSVTVAVFVDGDWVTLIDGKALLAPSARLSDSNGSYSPLYLNSAKGEKIRITMMNTDSLLGITITEMVLEGYARNVRAPEEENILVGKTFVPAAGTQIWNAKYGYEKLTDGIYDKDETGATNVHLGRYSSAGGPDAYMDGTVQLGAVYELSTLSLYDLSLASYLGDRIEVYAYYAGEWSLVHSISGKDTITNARVLHSNGLYRLQLDLSGVKAEALRVYAVNNTDSNSITMFEITCSGTRLTEKPAFNVLTDEKATATIDKTAYKDSYNILQGKVFVQNSGSTSVLSAKYGYPKLTDGIYNKNADGTTNVHLGRFGLTAANPSILDGTVELGATHHLTELRLYDFEGKGSFKTRIGDVITVFVRSSGEWKTVASISGIENVAATMLRDSTLNLDYVSIDLTGVEGDAIRVYVEDNITSQGITFYEIVCLGNIKSAEQIIESTSTDLTRNEMLTLTDKSDETYLAVGENVIKYSLVYDLGQAYSIYSLTLHEIIKATNLIDGLPVSASDDTLIELYVDGQWVPVSHLSLNDNGVTVISLYGIVAEKLRISFNNTRTFDNGKQPIALISEMYCSVGAEAADKKPLLDAYSGLAVLKNGGESYRLTMQEFYNCLTEFELTAEKAEQYAVQMLDFGKTLLGGTHTSHELVNYEAKDATCDTNGNYAYVACRSCDFTTYSETPVLGHTYDSDSDSECNICGKKRDLTDLLAFRGVYLNLNQDINVVYTVSIDSSISDAYMVFTFLGKEYTVREFTIRGDGTYAFAFNKVMPYYMAEEIEATLYGTKDGETLSVSHSGMSVKKYCNAVINLYPEDTKLLALVSDLLVYGEKAQLYSGYQVDNPVTKDVDWLAPSTFSVPESCFAINGDNQGAFSWQGVGLNLTSEMNMYFSFTAQDIEGLSVSVSINGRETIYDVSDLTTVDGKYRIYFRGINAYEFADEVVVNFIKDDSVQGATLVYSVNSYISYMYSNSDTTLAELVKAISNYGKSAADYK